jgi:sulfatase maturation enzyme AslB (radical SAM superfamily)
LDNVCNSACQTCNENLSTKIGSLKSQDYIRIDNSNRFWSLPLDRVVHLDINGGEPSASKNYQDVLQNIPPNIKSIRINTNCSTVMSEISNLINRGIHVTVTVSLDGIEAVHDYVRWPIKWDKFYKNLMTYKNLGIQELNTWTTVSALNIGDFENILKFVKDHELNHSYALLQDPEVLNVKYSNSNTLPFKDVLPGQVAVDINNQLELDAFIAKQNTLRGII